MNIVTERNEGKKGKQHRFNMNMAAYKSLRLWVCDCDSQKKGLTVCLIGKQQWEADSRLILEEGKKKREL